MNTEEIEQTVDKLQLSGWCSGEERRYFIDLVRSENAKLIVEIGVFGGTSFLPFALAMPEDGHIVGIDPWDGDIGTEGLTDPAIITFWHSLKLEQIYLRLRQVIADLGLVRKVELIRNRSSDKAVVDRFWDNSIDILHIDGNHTHDAVLADAQYYFPKVRDGGIIIFDDANIMDNGKFTVRNAANWIIEQGVSSSVEQFDNIIIRK